MLLEEKRVLREIRGELHGIRGELHSIVAFLYRDQSTTAVLTTSGDNNMATTAVLTFTQSDDTTPGPPPKGDGSGIVVTFSSDNPAVTLGAATPGPTGDTAQAAITGTDAFNLSAVVANSSGATLLDDDGVTDFVQPSPIAVAASTPQTTTAVLSTE
jgi:hypothetical protein